MGTKVEVHTKFMHNTSGPEWDDYDRHLHFLPGVIYEVPDDAADYFIRAGWASKPGGEPIKVEFDPTKPIFLNPNDALHRNK